MTSPTEQIDAIRADLAQHVEAIHANADYSDAHKRRLVARAYLDARQRIADLRATVERAAAAEELDLERALFSADAVLGLSKYDPAARAGAVVALRDAQDRVQAILDADTTAGVQGTLLDLLGRAERTGDEYLARAVADAGLRHGYLDVRNAFVDKRPGLEAKVQRLVDIHGTPRKAANAIATELAYAVERPAELATLGDLEVAALARGETSDAVA